jgi:hypothetical protein
MNPDGFDRNRRLMIEWVLPLLCGLAIVGLTVGVVLLIEEVLP